MQCVLLLKLPVNKPESFGLFTQFEITTIQCKRVIVWIILTCESGQQPNPVWILQHVSTSGHSVPSEHTWLLGAVNCVVAAGNNFWHVGSRIKEQCRGFGTCWYTDSVFITLTRFATVALLTAISRVATNSLYRRMEGKSMNICTFINIWLPVLKGLSTKSLR